ncbi:MFS drug transporter [Rhodotorula toruloides]|uniref:MFS drug transporter n=1 Tax=Rhodotorula toruloides TaxID=5286 RepID=A0A511K8L1_RHOTO|nr:MFS drug transporter [Rhodotorula toruloides]
MTEAATRPPECEQPEASSDAGRQGDRGPAEALRDEIEERDGPAGDAASDKAAIEAAADMSAGPGGTEAAGKGEEDNEGEQLATHHKNGLQDQTSYMPVKQILVVFASMQLAVLLAFLDQTIVSVALPYISAYFNAGRSSAFVTAAYLLTSSAMQPVWGRLSDIFGRKYTLMLCVLIFAIGSLACALARTMVQLIVFRGMQGVGGAGLLTLILIIISDTVSLKERGKYQGVTEITIMLRVSGSSDLPCCAAAIAVIAYFLPLKAVKGSAKEKLKKIDYGGAMLTVAATVLLILPLNWGGTSFAWVSGHVLGCLIASFFAFAVFFLWEWKVASIPIVPPFIFKNQTVAAIFASTFLSGSTILCQLYYLPQYFQVVRGDSPTRSGVLLIPQLVTTTVFVFLSGQLVSRTGEYKPSIVVGYAIWAVGLGLLSTLDQHSSTARIVGYQLLSGAGQGQTLQTSMVAAQAAVERSEMSVVTSVRNFMRSLGGTVFLVVAATILNNNLSSKLTPLGYSHSTISAIVDDPVGIWHSSSRDAGALYNLSSEQKAQIVEAYVVGFNTVFHVLTGLIGANFLIALLLIKRHSLQRKDEEALKQRGKEWIEHRKEKKRRAGGRNLDEAEKGQAELAEKKEEERE